MVEEALGELVHAVAVAGAVEHVGEQHGVVAGGDLDPVVGQHAGVVFEVVADLEDRGVGEHGPQALDHGRQVELAVAGLAELVDMGQRDVEALAGLDREADADQPGAPDVERGGLGVDRE